MRRRTYFAIATGLMFALPAQAQTTTYTPGKVPLNLPPGSKNSPGVTSTSNTEAGPPQLKKPATTSATTTTPKK